MTERAKVFYMSVYLTMVKCTEFAAEKSSSSSLMNVGVCACKHAGMCGGALNKFNMLYDDTKRTGLRFRISMLMCVCVCAGNSNRHYLLDVCVYTYMHILLKF